MSVERLTEWNSDHTHGQILRGDAATKLCQYEDTGLNPEDMKEILDRYVKLRSLMPGHSGAAVHDEAVFDRIRELVEADKDGRCVVMPCKVGDMVYEPYDTDSIDCAEVKEIEVTIHTLMGVFDVGDFGKTLFSSLESAISALAAQKEAENG